jgi:hypothetical protein
LGVPWSVTRDLPRGRAQVGDRHLKFHEDRDNLAENTTGRTGVFAATRAAVPQRTLRTDAVVVSAADGRPRLAAFIIYATARAFWGSAYWVADYHYLTPFYSPCISASCEPGASHLGVWLGHFPAWIPLGMLVLPFLLAFRITCYYHRRAYYRSVWQAPPACAVPDAGRQRHPLCERHQMLARHRGELVSVPEGELAQEDPQRGGRIHLVEYPRGAAGASTLTSSMLSAPHMIPAMIEGQLASRAHRSDFTRVDGGPRARRSVSKDRSAQPSSSTGTNQADDTRFCSSNTADPAVNV